MLMFSTCMFSQESLTVRYDYVVKSEDGIKVSENPTNVIIIYNYLDSGDVLIINPYGEKSRLYVTRHIKEDETHNGDKFNLFEAIHSELNTECFFQIFNDFTFRIIFKHPVVSLTFYKEN